MTAYSASLSDSLTTLDSYSAVMPTWIDTVWTTVNFAPNPSFEEDTPGNTPAAWSSTVPPYWLNSGATLIVNGAGGIQRSQYLRVTTTSASAFQGASLPLVGTFSAGVTYTASVYLITISGSTSLNVGLGPANADNANVNVTINGAWTRYSVTWTPSSNETVVYLSVRTSSAAVAQFGLDGAMVALGSSPSLYFDGDSAGYYWSGTPGNSATQIPSGGLNEFLTTDDTFSHQYTAVRPLIDQTGAASLGTVNLPILFTTPGYMDVLTRQAVEARSIGEQVTASDSLRLLQHMVGVISETLSIDDSNLVLQQTLKRRLSDTILYVGESVTHSLSARRRISEALGTDLLVSPMLLFPIPRLDVLTRSAGHNRIAPTVLHTTDSGTRNFGARRLTLADSFSVSDTMIRHLSIHRSPVDTLSSLQSLIRTVHTARILPGNLQTLDVMLRQISSHRGLNDALTLLDQYSGFSNKPRNTTDTLITHDVITLVNLIQTIYGQIWLANDGTVVADLPDWGWVLVEDPNLGNSMSVVPIPAATLDPTRQK